MWCAHGSKYCVLWVQYGWVGWAECSSSNLRMICCGSINSTTHLAATITVCDVNVLRTCFSTKQQLHYKRSLISAPAHGARVRISRRQERARTGRCQDRYITSTKALWKPSKNHGFGIRSVRPRIIFNLYDTGTNFKHMCARAVHVSP